MAPAAVCACQALNALLYGDTDTTKWETETSPPSKSALGGPRQLPKFEVDSAPKVLGTAIRRELLGCVAHPGQLKGPKDSPWFPIYPHLGARAEGEETPFGEVAHLLEDAYEALSGPQLAGFARANPHLFTRSIMEAIMKRGYWKMAVRHASSTIVRSHHTSSTSTAPHTTRSSHTPLAPAPRFGPPALQATEELMYEFRKGGPTGACGWLGACTGYGLDETLTRVKMYDAVVPEGTTGVTEWQGEGPLPDTPPGSLDVVGAACAARNLSTAGDMAAAMALAARASGGKLIFTDIGGGRGEQGMAAALAALEALERGGIVREVTATKVELGDGTVVSKLTAERTALPLSLLPTMAAAHPLQGRSVQLFAAADPDGRSDEPSCRLEGASHAVRTVEHPHCATTKALDAGVYFIVTPSPSATQVRPQTRTTRTYPSTRAAPLP